MGSVLLNASLLVLQSVTITARCPSCWWSVQHVTYCSVMLNSKKGRRGQMDSMFSAKHSGANRRERALLFMKNMWNQSNPNYPPAVHVARRARHPSRGTATQIESITHTLSIAPYWFKYSYSVFYICRLELMVSTLIHTHAVHEWLVYALPYDWTLTHTQSLFGAHLTNPRMIRSIWQTGNDSQTLETLTAHLHKASNTHCTYI